jgi:hypothetical protein
MSRRAGGGECAWQCEHNHGLALEDLIAAHIDPLMITAGVELYLGDILSFTIFKHNHSPVHWWAFAR